jgi:predicted permease
VVSRDYLGVMGIRAVAGRMFTEQDDAGTPRVLLINQALARQLFAGADPIGAQVYIGRDTAPWEIVGVVADVRQFGIDQPAEPQYFLEVHQLMGTGPPLFPTGAYYVARTDGDPQRLVAPLRRLLREVDREAVLFNVAPMDTLVGSAVARPRMYATLLGVFAGIGLVIALVGIYGVMAYVVGQRTREIGIRGALGASAGALLWLVLRHSLLLTLIGIGLGLLGAAATTRFLEGLLFGLTPLDRSTIAGVSLAFVVVALLAALIPAARAARVDPLVALRTD